MPKLSIRNWTEIKKIVDANVLAINVTNRDKNKNGKFCEELLERNLQHIRDNKTGDWKGGDIKKRYDFVLLFHWNSKSGNEGKDLYLSRVKYDEAGAPLLTDVGNGRFSLGVVQWKKIGVSYATFKEFCSPTKRNDSQISWLLGKPTLQLTEELRKVPKLQGGYKDVQVKIRLNHGRLRKTILKNFANRCCLTGIENNDLLICSHIKPYSKSEEHEQNDPENVLLLAANWDRAFDKFLISFDAKGRTMISSKLTKNEITNLGIDKKLQINSLYLTAERLGFLAWHRKEFEKRALRIQETSTSKNN